MLNEKITEKHVAMKTAQLVMIPAMGGMLLILILVGIGFAGYRGTLAYFILSGLTFFLWGCTGIPLIVRKEVPYLSIMSGWAAVVVGLIFLVIGWGIALGFAILIANLAMG